MSLAEKEKVKIGLLAFTNLTQLDLTGPYEVFSRAPNAKVYIVAKSMEPVVTEKGLRLLPDVAIAGCPALDIVVIPGGPGQLELMEDDEVLQWIRTQASTSAQYVTSVCTGALVLGAAGLLKGGVPATTHWLFVPLLRDLGAEPIDNQRVVQARITFPSSSSSAPEKVQREITIISGGGITAGMDFGLAVVKEIWGTATAQLCQLSLEYNPQPPPELNAGSPLTAPPEVVAKARSVGEKLWAKRIEVNRRVVERYPFKEEEGGEGK